jgi:hypothetical protein
MDSSTMIGRAPERLSIEERGALAGKWVALEVYTPATIPLKRIEAIGASVVDCVTQLQERGLDPRVFEFVVMRG